MSNQPTFSLDGSFVSLELPCDKCYLEMFEQFIAKVILCFGFQNKSGDECLQSVSLITGTVLKASESMPFSPCLVEFSVRENALTVSVEYYRDGTDQNVGSQPIEQLLRLLNKENKNWDDMAKSFEFSHVNGIDCRTVALPLPQNGEQAGS